MQYKSKDIAKVSVEMAMSSREEEQELKDKYSKKGIKTAAVDIGGNVVESIPKILEWRSPSGFWEDETTGEHYERKKKWTDF